MFDFLKPVPVYLMIYRDRMEMVNLRTGASVSRTGKFSNDRMLVGSFGDAQLLAKDIARELRLRGKRLKMLVQQKEIFEGGLTDIEKRAMRDIAEQVGAVSVLIVTDERSLSNEEALEIVSSL